jgi:hypothetical protein
MKWIPRVVYTRSGSAPTTLDFTLPQRLWTPLSIAVGGSEVSAAGVPESFVIRRDQLLDLRLAFREGEWPAVHAWLAWMQDTAGFCVFYPDRAVGTSRTCYLETPKVGEEIRPERGDYPGIYELAVRLRSTAPGDPPFDVRAYE